MIMSTDLTTEDYESIKHRLASPLKWRNEHAKLDYNEGVESGIAWAANFADAKELNLLCAPDTTRIVVDSWSLPSLLHWLNLRLLTLSRRHELWFERNAFAQGLRRGAESVLAGLLPPADTDAEPPKDRSDGDRGTRGADVDDD